MQKTQGVHQACAACKHQRKKCNEGCILAPYFPANRTREFHIVHKFFGVSNITKIVKNVNEEYRRRVVDSLVWEACCRQKDPILGSYGEYRKVYDEYKRVFDELKIYKNQNQIVQLPVQAQAQDGMNLKVITWNRINGLHREGVDNTLNYAHDNKNGIFDSYTHGSNFAPSLQNVNVRGEVVNPLQQTSQDCYIPGELNHINGNNMESSTIWDCGS